MIAVWDGRDGQRAGTGTVVELARQRGIPVDVVWPQGAARDYDANAGIGANLLTMGRKSWSVRSLVPPPHRLDPADHPLSEAGVVARDHDVASRFWQAP